MNLEQLILKLTSIEYGAKVTNNLESKDIKIKVLVDNGITLDELDIDDIYFDDEVGKETNLLIDCCRY